MQVTHRPRVARSGAALRGDLLRRLNVKNEKPDNAPLKITVANQASPTSKPTGAQSSPEVEKGKRWRSRDGLALDPEQLVSLLLPSAPLSSPKGPGGWQTPSRVRDRAASIASDIGDYAIEAAVIFAEQDAENSRSSLHRGEASMSESRSPAVADYSMSSAARYAQPSSSAIAEEKSRGRRDSDSEGEEGEEDAAAPKGKPGKTPNLTPSSTPTSSAFAQSPLLAAYKSGSRAGAGGTPASPLGIGSPSTRSGAGSLLSPSKHRGMSDFVGFSLSPPSFSDELASLETPANKLEALELKLPVAGKRGEPVLDLRYYIQKRAQRIALRDAIKSAKPGKTVEHSPPVAELIRKYAQNKSLVFLANPAHNTSMHMNPDEYTLPHSGLAFPEVMPRDPVVRGDPKWTVSSSVAACQHCNGRFTLMQRKHHCRGCGAVVCAECTPHKTKDMTRLCRACNALRRGTVLRRAKHDTQSFMDAIAAGELSEVEKRLQWGQPVNVHAGVDGTTPLHVAVSVYGFAAHRQQRDTAAPTARSLSMSSSSMSPWESSPASSIVGALNAGSRVGSTTADVAVDASITMEQSATLASKLYASIATHALKDISISQEEDEKAVTILKLLLRNGASVNNATFSGITPLHAACAYGTPAIVKVLLDSGALQARTDACRFSAYDYATIRSQCISDESSAFHLHGQQIKALLDTKYATGVVENHRNLLSSPVRPKRDVVSTPPAFSHPWKLCSRVEDVPDEDLTTLLSSPLARVLAGADPALLGIPEGSGGEGPSEGDAANQSRAEALPMPPKSQLLEMGVQTLDPAAQALQANLLAVRNGYERRLNEDAWMSDFGGGMSFRSKFVELGILPVLSWHELAWRRECQIVGRVWKLGHPPDCEGDVAPAVEQAYAARNPTSPFLQVLPTKKDADPSTEPPSLPVLLQEDDVFEKYSANGADQDDDDDDTTSDQISTATAATTTTTVAAKDDTNKSVNTCLF